MDLQLQLPGILMVRASILFSAHMRCHIPAPRATPSFLLHTNFSGTSGPEVKCSLPSSRCGELNLNSPAHECQYLRAKPHGWFSVDKEMVNSPWKLFCQEKRILIFEGLNYTSLQKAKSQCFKTQFQETPPLHFFYTMFLTPTSPSLPKSTASHQAGWGGRGTLMTLKQNS